VTAGLVAAGAAALAVSLVWPGAPTWRSGVRSRRFGLVVGITVATGLLLTGQFAVDHLGPLVLAGLVGGAGWRLRRRAGLRRAAAVRAEEVLELCEELAGDLAAGSPPGLVLERASSRWPCARGPASAHQMGGSVPDAWRLIADERGASDFVFVAAAWQVAERTGAGLAGALTSVAEGLRDQQRTRRVVASELASARATARLMAALPLLTLAVGSGAGDPVGFLLGTPAGLLCAGAGLTLGCAGLAWIEAIAGSLERASTTHDSSGSPG
jgi:tight adherence protein B